MIDTLNMMLKALTLKGSDMSEPTTGTAGVALGWKLIGGTAGALGIGAALASAIVMLMTPPRSPREWAVGLICTLVGSIAGGAFVIEHYALQTMMSSFTGLLSVLGIAFACGLPAWAIVRWTFTFIEKRKNADIAEVAAEVRKQMGV
jgi:hypothetical protein